MTYDDLGRPAQTSVADPGYEGTGVAPQVVDSTMKYTAASRGRVTELTDALGHITKTQWVDNAQGQTVSQTVSQIVDDVTWSTTTTMDPYTQVPLTVKDLNGLVTSGTYDALARVHAVWYPERPQSSNADSPSVKYEYTVSSKGLNAVKTETLNTSGTGYDTSVALYDGLYRPLETQAPGVNAAVTNGTPKKGATAVEVAAAAAARGRLVTETSYDSAGRAYKTTGQWWDSGVPAVELLDEPERVPGATTVTFDDAGRTTGQTLWTGEVTNPANARMSTTTVYDGLTTLTIPPTGGVPTAVTTDARGNTVCLRQYLRDTAAPAAPKGDPAFACKDVPALMALKYQDTTYTYDRDNQLEAITDAAGATWKYVYDQGGRQVKAIDPDGGTTTTDYNRLGAAIESTDAIGNAATDPAIRSQHTTVTTYDDAGRITGVEDGAGVERTVNEYDQAAGPNGNTKFLGAQSSSTQKVDGADWVTKIEAYDTAGRPVTTTTVLPETAAGVAALGTRVFTQKATYTPGGDLETLTYPKVTAVGSGTVLADETVRTTFDAAGQEKSLSGAFGWGTYVADARWDEMGRISAIDEGTTYGAVASYRYDDVTGRLTNIRLDRERVNGTDLDVAYTYDDAGNVTSVFDHPTNVGLIPAGGKAADVADNQCFSYDGLGQLTRAWTQYDLAAVSAPCQGNGPQGAPAVAQVGGAAPYWQDFTYDIRGNRTSLVEHIVGNGVANLGGARTTSYDHDSATAGAGVAGPHQVTSQTTTTTDANANTLATSNVEFTYDAAGNRLTRVVEPRTDDEVTTLYGWNADGALASVAISGDTATGENTLETGEEQSVYGADGERIYRQDASGATFFAAGQEIHVAGTDQDATVTAVRYYEFAGQQVASRSGAGLGGATSLVCDPHGTVLVAVPNTDWSLRSVKRAYASPFGGDRATLGQLVAGEPAADVVPGDRQFLGKTRDDATGLVLLGARWYDAAQGRFVSVDPQLDPGNPAQLNAYVYAGNNPMTFDDPTGENWLTKHISKAWKSTKSFAKKHAASAASFVAGAVVGAVLGAGVTAACGALGFCTGGVGGVVCATVGYAFVGAVSGAVSGAVRSIVSQKIAGKPIRWKSVGKAALSDAISGAVGGALGGPLLGKVVGKVARPLTTRLSAAGSRIGSKVGQTRAGQALVGAARKVGLACSFAGDTPVVMADGSAKPIEEARAGDVVTSPDPATGQVGKKVVEDTYVHDDITITVYVNGAAVQTTEDHPWYSVESGQFVRADKLQAGDHVLTIDGIQAEVTGIDLTPAWEPAYNLTVTGWHTYHVLTAPDRGPPAVGGTVDADSVSILVHNCAMRGDRGRFVADPNRPVGGQVVNGRVAGTNEPGLLTSRGAFRKETKQNAWDSAETGPNGGRMCPTGGPNCAGEVMNPIGHAGGRDWDVSHNPSWTNRWFDATARRSDVIDDYQHGTFLECIPCNRGGGNNDGRFG